MHRISIIGIGRVGGALALALSKANFEIDYLIHRDPGIAETIAAQIPGNGRLASFESFPEVTSEIVLITTSDPEISAASNSLARHLEKPAIVLHTSGSLSSDILGELAAIGCPIGSMHPLVSISEAVSGSANFSNAFFCLEGDKTALAAAASIVKALGGRPFTIASGHKPLYHAAAVTACGHVVALIDIAIEMLSKCGIDQASAKQVLLPLIESTIGNLELQSPQQALTGSFARADSAALERHLASIDGAMSPTVREIYLLLGERSLDLAEANGANASDVQRMRERIGIAKRKSE